MRDLHLEKLTVEECSEKIWNLHICVSRFYDEYAKSVGLTLAALKVLGFIARRKSCTQKEITQLTYLPKQTVNAIIKGFKEQELIQEPVELDSDKRNKIITFTKKGEEYAHRIISKAKEAEFRALDSMGEKRRTMLIEAMETYKNNLKI